MATKTNISWTDATWNIARGCTKVDEDCKFCYMYRDSFDGKRYNPREVVRTKTVFDFPLKFKKGKSDCWNGKPLIFTSSLTDFFHPQIDSYRHEAWEIIRKCPQYTFQILTKRPERIKEHLPKFWNEIKHHVWLGTSVGSEEGIQRIIYLIKCRELADVLFVSVEPFHSEFNFRWKYTPEDWRNKYGRLSHLELLKNIDWVIIGGESGNETGKYRYRPCKIEWINELVDECKEIGVSIFVKQLGTHLAKELKLKHRHGADISEFPKHLQIQEFPNV